MSKRITSQIILLLVGLLPMSSFAQDLIISNLEVIGIDPGSANISITYEYRITNIGSDNIPTSVNGVGVRVSISNDQIQSTDDVVVNDNNIITGGIPPEQTITQTNTTTIPLANLRPYLSMKVDGQDLVDETDEGNNFAWTYITQPQEVPLNLETVDRQIIIQYDQLTLPELNSIQAILTNLGGVIVDECNCNRFIAVWQFDDPDAAQQAQALLEELDIFTDTVNADKKATVDGNELIGVELRHPPTGFELEPNATPEVAARNVLVYLIDSGLNTTPLSQQELGHLLNKAPQLCGDFDSQGFNYEFPPNITADFEDENCHGTFGYDAITKGTSNRIKVVPLKVFNKDGDGTLFGIICAIYHAIDNKGDIINISAGYQSDKENAILKSAVKEADSLGIFIVTAAGNEGDDVDTNAYYPAAFGADATLDYFISVASQNVRTGDLGDNSNFGQSSITMTGPGEKIFGKNHKGQPVVASGTSMAAFYVTRQLAIHISKQNSGDADPKAREDFLDEQDQNCLNGTTISGTCLDIDYNRSFIVFEWLKHLFSN